MAAVNRRSVMHLLALLALPAVYFATALVALVNLPPIWRLYTDPSYQYLLNGLSVTIGPGPGHTDHPGTSTQWLVGLVDLVFHAISGSGTTVIQDVVNRPETYLLANATVLVLLQSLALWFAGWRFTRSFGIGPALLLQAAVVSAVALYPHRLFVIPESTVLICGLLLLGLIAPKLARPGGQTGWRTVALVGVVLALGITGKVIFAPIVLIPLFLYNWRSLVSIYAWMLGTTVVVMWVARDQFQRMWDWYTAVATTDARYPGEPPGSGIVQNLLGLPGFLAQNYLVLWVSLAILVVGLIAAWRSGNPPSRATARAIAALGVGILGTFAMTYKSYRVNDFVMLAPLAGALAAMGWSYLMRARGTKAGRALRVTVPAIIAAASVVIGAIGAAQYVSSVTQPDDRFEMVAYLQDRIDEGASVAVGYGIFTPGVSLIFGNQSARYIAMRETRATYPGWMEFNIWNNFFYTFNDDGPYLGSCQELQAIVGSPGGLYVAPGRDVGTLPPGNQYASVRMQPTAVFGDQKVYKVEQVTCP